MASRDVRRVGVVGLGAMGSALADALIAKGFDVTVWNRAPAKAERFAKAGAKVAANVADAARGVDTLVVCLLDHAATLAAVTTDAVAEALKGKTLVQLTTMTSADSRALGAWCAANGVAYLEGQILHYPDDVRAGRAFIACAGPRRLYESCRPVLDAVAASAPHVSETLGAAAVLDKALFEIEFPPMVGFLHGAAMCAAVGIPIAIYAEIMIGACFKSGMIETGIAELARRVAARNYDQDVGAALETYSPAFSKTLRESEALGIETEHLKGVDDILRRACAAGHGGHEFAAVYEFFRPRSG